MLFMERTAFHLRLTAFVSALVLFFMLADNLDLPDYVPCTTPMNITISLNGVPYPIHPLDLTFTSGDVQDPTLCVGALQAIDLTTAEMYAV